MASEFLTQAPPAAGREDACTGTSVRSWAAAARRRMPLLWYSGWIALGLSVPLLVLGLLDERLLNGVSVWTKPWKFHVSVGIHLLTLALCAVLLADTPQRRRNFTRLSAVAVACSVFELAYITWRAARGEASHFNLSGTFANTMYALMGLGAVLMTACAGVLGLWIARARDFAHGPVLQRGLAVGLLMGWLLGTLAGAYVSSKTGHWVGGTPSDLQGLPLVRWSRDGGDLRVAHFFGLHAMQVLPFAAWVAARCLKPAAALRSVDTFAAAYGLFTVFTFVQAVMGHPLI
jgi:hypothetical protein